MVAFAVELDDPKVHTLSYPLERRLDAQQAIGVYTFSPVFGSADQVCLKLCNAIAFFSVCS